MWRMGWWKEGLRVRSPRPRATRVQRGARSRDQRKSGSGKTEMRQRRVGDRHAPLLHEVAALGHLHRRRAAADGLAQRRHRRAAQHRVLQANGHEAVAGPTVLPEGLRWFSSIVDLQQATGGRLDASILRQLLIALAMIGIMLARPKGLWPSPERGKSLQNKPVPNESGATA